MEFELINKNPKGRKVGDCVIRAIANAECREWDTVYMRLCSIGLRKASMPNSKEVYEQYLKDNGWCKYKQPRKEDGSKYTVGEWGDYMAERLYYKDTVMLVTMANHMTMIGLDYGNAVIEDLWNCKNKCVSNYWLKGCYEYDSE